jgi:hypothetical protein
LIPKFNLFKNVFSVNCIQTIVFMVKKLLIW